MNSRNRGSPAWLALSGGARSAKSALPLAFLVRLEDAQSMLYNGVEQSTVRAKHGRVVLEAAIEANFRSVAGKK